MSLTLTSLAKGPLGRAQRCLPSGQRLHRRGGRPARASSYETPSNLGQLGRLNSVTQLSSEEDAASMLQRVDPSSFNDRGPYVDGGSIFASSVLLLVLLAFSTNRIFGLERLVVSAARAWREGRRQEELQKLQRMMDNSEYPGDGGTQATRGGPDPDERK